MALSSIKAIRYYGGKASDKTGGWIASKLPVVKRSVYVETHAGMLGVLLSRPRVNIELVNDLDSRLANFWRVLRDDGDNLIDMVDNTPHSREIFNESLSAIDDGNELQRAYKYFVVISQSLFCGVGNASWARWLHTEIPRPPLRAPQLVAIKKRIQSVHVDNCPAINLLERFADNIEAVIYVDPPYANTYNEPYAVVRYDRDETFELLKAQRGQVAVSGYDDEWDDLGWVKHTRAKTLVPPGATSSTSNRLEALWCNFELTPRLL